MDVSVLIYSCDNYSDVWEPFFTLFFRYWDCPYKVYVTAETKKCDVKNVITLNTTGDKWTDRIRKAVECIPTKYIIGMCEDMFFRRPVRQEIIDECLQRMKKDKDIANFNFEKSRTPTEECEYDNFSRKVCNYDYQKSCQPTLWNKDILLKLLSESQDPWEWETSETPSEYKYYIWTGAEDELVFEYGYHEKWFGIQKGRWVLNDVKPLFEKEGIEVDYSKRGYIEEVVDVEIKDIYIDGFGEYPIGKESDEEKAIRNGADELVFFYVPDDIFKQDDNIISNFVKDNCDYFNKQK